MLGRRLQSAPVERFSGDKVSGITRTTIATVATLMATRNQKTFCQPRTSPRKSPARGATAGVMGKMPISVERVFVDALPVKKSEATERARTIAESSTEFWSSRIVIRMPIFGVTAQRVDEPKDTSVTMRGSFLQPKLSENTLMTSYPVTMPTVKIVSVSWTIDLAVENSPAMSTKEVRQVSALDGPATDKRARPARSDSGGV